MSASPTEKWELKLLKWLFGPELIVRAYTINFLYEQTKGNKQLKTAETTVTDTILMNAGIGAACGVISVVLLQRAFPAYGRSFRFTNMVIDAGIFMLFTGGATLWSLTEVQPILEPLKKKWILEHNRAYLRKMAELQKTFQIGLLSQIEEYVPSQQRPSWKLKYDEVLLS